MSWQASNLHQQSHCFFDAKGGVSQGKYASLNTNLSSQDARINILHNFDIIAAHFNMQRQDMVTLRQGTSNKAIFINEPSWFKMAADGVVTTNQDILLGIKTADCAPVLLADYQNGVIGAAHAGWRGAYKGIIENVVLLMEKNGAKRQNIAAAIGPCLQQDSFQTQDDMLEMFLRQSAVNIKYFKTGSDKKYLFDLSKYIEDKLHVLGIENVQNSHIDTYTSDDYFSYRRNTHLNLIEIERDYPTQYSLIKL